VNIFGWLDRPKEVEKVKSTLKYADATQLIRDENLEDRTRGGDPVLFYLLFRKVTGKDCPCGPQKIGDCVSWGWSNCLNYLQIIKISSQIKKLGLWGELKNGGFSEEIIRDHPNYQDAQAALWEWQEVCTEWVYGSSRVEIGGQKGDTEDGSVGAWAAKAVAQLGVATRKKYGPYDPQRAKSWGAEGVPDDYEPEAKKHPCNDVVPVTSYDQLVTMLRAYRPVPVCSNQGFTMTRDAKGACRPEGNWGHCMLFCGLDDKGNPLIAQSWGPDQPGGPVYLDQPTNTFFVDPDTADRMLKANDSFCPAGFLGYEVEDFIDWKH
jgi:hypothetical protein